MSFLRRFRAASVERVKRWHGEGNWTILEWAGAMCGEAGEAANIAKKIRRLENEIPNNGLPNDEQTRIKLMWQLADEIADTFCYLDIMAAQYGLDMETIIANKFNAVSDRYGFPEKI